MSQDNQSVRNQGAIVADFERKLEALRIMYEHFFLGLERREPQAEAQAVFRQMRQLDQISLQNTALNFRYRGLVAKLNTYRNYWTRTLRAIENGTYHRDVARVKRRLKREGIEVPDLAKLRSAGALEQALVEANTQRAKTKKRRSASDIRGKPAEALQQDALLNADPNGSVPAGADDSQRHAPVAPDASSDRLEPLAAVHDEHIHDELDRMFDEVTTRPAAFSGPVGSPPPPPPQAFTLDAAPPPSPPAAKKESAPAEFSISSTPPSGRERRMSKPRGKVKRSPPVSADTRKTPPGMTQKQMDSLYRRYVKAKKMCGEDPAKVRYDSLVKTISSQLPKIRQQNPNKEVDFQVVIREGKALLKAKTK